jgi:putative hydrolase of the HAD superfamily
MSARRAVLLDALGVLLELEPPGPPLRAALHDELGLEVAEAAVDAAVAAEIAYYRAHHDEAGDQATLAALRRRCAAVLRESLATEEPRAADLDLGSLTDVLVAALRFRAYAEVPRVLAELRVRGLRLVVVSNWDVSLHVALAETGLADLVDGAISSAELGAAKPDPSIFRHALTLAGVPAPAAIHVGDDVDADVAGARAAGIEPVLVDRHGTAARADPPVRTIGSLDELLEPAP